MGYEQPAIRSSRFFSSCACASARSRGVSINPAAVIPAPAVLKNSRRSTPMPLCSFIVQSSSFLTARGAPPPLALARRLRASLGPQALSFAQVPNNDVLEPHVPLAARVQLQRKGAILTLGLGI